MEPEEWLPEANFYLAQSDRPHVRPRRPFCQGDILVDVPVALYRKHPPKRIGEYPTAAKEQMVMLYSHPCTLYEGAVLSQVQTVVIVARADGYFPDGGWQSPWDGNLRLFPLPGLTGQSDYVADLGQIGVTRSEYFSEKRIACLNLPQLAAFQGRCARLVSRMNPPLAEHKRRVAPLWEEFRLWENWWDVCGARDGFQEWLDQPSRSRPGATRRQALSGAPEEVENEMNEDFGGRASL
ncbi:MAG: hypothetical protein ACLP01_17280 [Solirubrobacteraceae bacterium]